jgi:hypothetical protein
MNFVSSAIYTKNYVQIVPKVMHQSESEGSCLTSIESIIGKLHFSKLAS